MRRRILDTSVAVAWYLPESYTQAARKWRDAFASRRVHLIAPSLHLLEMANVLRTYVRRGELAESLALEIYETHLDAGIEIIEPAPAPVLATALEYGATAYDAAFIRLALELDAPLLTAERTTTPWVLRLGKLAEIIR
jgi:predicted nucleic acid-binding protein